MSTTDRILGGNLSRRAFLSRLAIIPGGSACPGLRLRCHCHRTHSHQCAKTNDPTCHCNKCPEYYKLT